MIDFDVSSNRQQALSQESLERACPSQFDGGYPLQHRGNNRLLALEAELRERQQVIQSSTEQSFAQAQPANTPQYQPTRCNNRWLELERELQLRWQSNTLPQSGRPSIPAPPSPKPTIQRQVFDYNKPIHLQYHSDIFPCATSTISDRAPPKEVPAASNTWKVANSLDEVKSEVLAPPPNIAKQQPPVVPDNDKQPVPKSTTLEELATALLEIINEQNRQPVEFSATSANPSPHEPEINANLCNSFTQQMGTDMPYTTEFDLGTIELEQLFDTFDLEIEQTEQAELSDLEQRFDEFDLALDRQQSGSSLKLKPISRTKRPGLGFAPKKPQISR